MTPRLLLEGSCSVQPGSPMKEISVASYGSDGLSIAPCDLTALLCYVMRFDGFWLLLWWIGGAMPAPGRLRWFKVQPGSQVKEIRTRHLLLRKHIT
ncbi:hypothetical protein TNCV_3077921 [Trichonephila clavipes]|nr:hypothetical protein TNCV_3077921 [Trichonephila clavipes]